MTFWRFYENSRWALRIGATATTFWLTKDWQSSIAAGFLTSCLTHRGITRWLRSKIYTYDSPTVHYNLEDSLTHLQNTLDWSTKHPNQTIFILQLYDWKWSVTQNMRNPEDWVEQLREHLLHALPIDGWIDIIDLQTLLIYAPAIEPRFRKDFAEHMLRITRTPLERGGEYMFGDGCIGVSSFDSRSIKAEQWYHEAQLSMQIAMEKNEDVQFYSSDLEESTKRVRLIEQELIGALKRNEFVLHYQPKVDPNHRLVIGAETLLRWNHPRLGLVPPKDFIPIAEQTGLIHLIGDWVLKEACEQVATWQNDGLPNIVVSVNVSASQLQRSGYAAFVMETIRNAGIEPHWIELEITESESIREMSHVLNTMNQLRNTGVKMSIDDFGTGYSTYEYLYHLPVHTLKMDLAFLMKGNKIREREIIVRSMIDLAKSLHLQVIAEGVETADWFEFLRRLGCDGIQGYYISRPEPATILESMLKGDIRFAPFPIAATAG